MATTTNYGWDTPDDTDLVKDGASAIRTLGSSVDTTVKNLNPETTLGDISYRSSTANTNTRLAIGTTGQVLTVSGGVPAWGNGGGITLISTTSLSGSSVSLTSIPQTYKDLRIIIQNYLPATDDTKIQLRFNNVSTNNYTGLITTVTTETAFGSSLIDLVRTSDNANAAGSLIKVDIPDYVNSSTWKWLLVASAQNWAPTPTTISTTFGFGVHNNTAAITRIDLIQSSGNFTSGTVLLYGVN